MTQETEKTPARIEDAIRAMIEARVVRERTEAEIAAKRAQEKSLRDRMALLEAALQPRAITAWCADATEDAEGTVGTIEVNGEFGAQDSILVVAPQEVLPTLQAGAIVSREVQSGHQAYFNAALLPGWQKHQPTYRAGQIRAIDRAANTCTVDLDAARSSAQRLDINQATTLTGVPVRYMRCDAAAFEDDDRVIVEFQEQDWARPVVIGFVERPRPCGALAVLLSAEVRAAPWPWSPEEDWILFPYRSRYFEFDPETGEAKNFGAQEDSRSYSEWVEVDGVFYRYIYTTVHRYPFVWNRKTWAARKSNQSAPFSGRVIAHDGEIVDFPPVFSMTLDGSELVALEWIEDGAASHKVKVFDAKTRSPKREWGFAQLLQMVKSRDGRAVLWRGFGSSTDVAVMNHKTGAVLRAVSFASRAVVDIAINLRRFAVLYAEAGGFIIELFDIETGESIDKISASGAYAIAMNERYMIAVCASGEFGALYGTPGGGINVYRIFDDGLSFVRTDFPVAPIGDAEYPYAG